MISKLYDFLVKAAEACGEKVAFKDNNRSLTYYDLRLESVKVGKSLLSLGIQGMPVLIVEESCVECASMVYGVAYSGNYYTICNPGIKTEGLQEMIDAYEPAVILSRKKHQKYINDNHLKKTRVLYFDDCIEYTDLEINCSPCGVLPQDPAFIVYTSGSSGKPKGVVIPNIAVEGFINAYKNYMCIDFALRNAEVNANMFVIFSLHLFAVVALCGMEYIFSDRELFLSHYLEKIKNEELNTMFCISSVLSLVAKQRSLEYVDISNLTRVMYGGQQLSNEHLLYWMDKLHKTDFIQFYGSTESLLPITHKVQRSDLDEDNIPFDSDGTYNVKLLILDEKGCLSEVGEVGELYIKSDRTALGYYKDEVLTNQNFVQNPMHSDFEDIVYKSGDLAYIDKSGKYYLVGRKDSMIKRRGYRIELGEIDRVGAHLNGIDECVSLYDENEDIIVFFYEGTIKESELQQYFRKNISAYKIPDRLCKVEGFPHNANGKIDRAKLKEMMSGQSL